MPMSDGLGLVAAFAAGVALQGSQDLIRQRIESRALRAKAIRERRDALYLQLIELMISIPTRVWDAVVRDDSAGLLRDFGTEWNRLRAELFVFGSRRVQRSVEDVRAQVDVFTARSADLRAEEDAKDPHERLGADRMPRKAFEQSLGPAVTKAVVAIRRDLRLGWRRPVIKQVT